MLAPDLLVIGGGNAALTAAITAREQGVSVAIMEAAPKPYRGGNSRHTRNVRCMHQGPMGVLSDCYGYAEYYEDLLKVTGGKTDPELAHLAITQSALIYEWMHRHGVHFQPSLSGTLSLSRTNAFFLGGGKALVNALYGCAEDMGCDIYYETSACHLEIEQDRVAFVRVERDGEQQIIRPKAIVVACGGFQADLDWLADAWGPAARNFLIRGTPYNRGVVLRNLLDQGVQSVGDPTQCHAVAIDGRAPKFDGGIVTRLDCVPFSITVNKHAKRFYDEGEDVWPKRYAIWGRLVAAQPDQRAYAIIDRKSQALFMPSVFAPVKADTIEELAKKLELPGAELQETVRVFNQACRPGNFEPTELDGLATAGISPPKTNWARPLDQPPYCAYMLRPGVTFTYLGLQVDKTARVAGPDGPMQNLWAAGEIMAGSILGQGYLAGFGMVIGSVFGKIAGAEAASYV
ncbi:MAG: FAD-dependent tricarballylate dehydrogenase TcuA [Pseudomonadota bacterium]